MVAAPAEAAAGIFRNGPAIFVKGPALRIDWYRKPIGGQIW